MTDNTINTETTMADINEAVLKMVQEELAANPEITNQELYDKAVALDKGIKKLSLRQFHARYPLQVKRQQAVAEEPAVVAEVEEAGESNGPPIVRRGRRGRKEVEPDRNSIRTAFIEFAQAVATAETKGDIIGVIGGVEEYVERVVGALR